MSTGAWVVVGLFTLFLIGVYSKRRKESLRIEKLRQRRVALLAKYGDDGIVDDVLAGNIRMGMTADQVIESWGDPAAVDEKVFKAKTVHTFKYGMIRTNQFRSRVKLENGYVVGWEQK